MKRSILAVVYVCGLLAFAGSAWALPLTIGHGITVVGDRDTLIAHSRLDNSGDATELNWVKSVLGTDYVTLDAKYPTETNQTPMVWQQIDGRAGMYALNLLADPEYFLIKTGGRGDDHFLFQNNGSLSWAVINLYVDLQFTRFQGVARISHIDEFNGAPVPEPGTILLLGGGFVGLALFGRKRMKP